MKVANAHSANSTFTATSLTMACFRRLPQLSMAVDDFSSS